MIISIVPNEHLSTAWLLCEPFIRLATDRLGDRIDTFEVWESIVKNEYQLWVIADETKIIGSFVTHVVQRPKHRYLSVPYLGSEPLSIKSWFDDALSAVEVYAKANGCTYMEMYGRDGWAKHSLPKGFKKAAAIYEKRIV